MGSDNIFEQVEALIASDERQQPSELVERFLATIGHVPGAHPIVSLVRHHAEKQRSENAELMLKTAWQELKRVSFSLEELDSDHRKFVESEQTRRLILDAVRKSEDLRDVHRVERIGRILSCAITIGPASDLDKAEELMRVARDLSDQDVVALRLIYETQFELLQKFRLKIPADDVNIVWREHQLKIPGVLFGELDSILLKLQGLGLITSVERRETYLEPNERPFALLAKGADFVRYMTGARVDEAVTG